MHREPLNERSGAKSFLKKLLGFSVSSYLGAIITFASTFINTRIFATDVLGKINLFITVQNFLFCFAYLGVDQAYCRYYNECAQGGARKRLFSKCFRISLIATVAIGCAVMIGWKQISVYIGDEQSVAVVISLVISTLAHMICRYLTLLQRMNQKILGYTILMVGLSVAHKLSYSVTSVISKDYITSIVAIGVAYVLLTTAFLFVERKHYMIDRGEKIESDAITTKRLLKFGLPLMPITLLSWLNNSIPTLMMKDILSYEAIGIYSNAVVITSVVNLVQSGFNTFWVPYYYENYKTGNDKIKKVHNIICFVMVAFAIAMVLFKDLLFVIVGQEYKSGAVLLALLLISPVCYTIGETTGIGISISEKSYLHSIAYIGGIAANLLFCILLIPAFGIVGAGIAVASAAIISLLIKSIIGERYYKSISNYLKSIAAILILIGAAIVDLFLIDVSRVLWVFGLMALLCGLMVIYYKEVKYLWAVGKSFLQRK